jgi:hypothetical protein
MPKSPKRSSSKSRKRIVLCKDLNKLYNPKSGRCVKKTGRIGKKLQCSNGKVRNPKSGRCVKKTGRIGKKVCASQTSKKVLKSKRKSKRM